MIIHNKKTGLIIIALIVILQMISMEPVMAKGTNEVVKAVAYYSHPKTGVIEDSGKNEGIGQGMVESVVSKDALFENIEDNNCYLTLRLNMMDDISDVRFSVENTSSKKWVDVKYKVTQKNINNKDNADFRIPVSSKGNIVKIKVYIEAMGRDVTFFVGIRDGKAGTGDFCAKASSKEINQGGDKVKGLTTSTELKSEGVENSNNKGNIMLERLSWIFVLQCILIITIPPLVIAGFIFMLQRIRSKKKEDYLYEK